MMKIDTETIVTFEEIVHKTAIFEIQKLELYIYFVFFKEK